MKSNSLVWFLLFSLSLVLTGCAANDAPTLAAQAATQTVSPVSSRAAPVTPESGQAATQSTIEIVPSETANPPEGNPMIDITLSVGGSSFSAKLHDNETTRALLAQLPLDLEMSELNGREKFYDLPADLPVFMTESPATISAGEIMLWSSNTLVLFYNTFPNSYGGYVKLGYIEDLTGLAEALGSGNVRVKFTVGK